MILPPPSKKNNEDIFLQELLDGKAKWKAEAEKLAKAGVSNVREAEYAEAYRVLLNRFTKDPEAT